MADYVYYNDRCSVCGMLIAPDAAGRWGCANVYCPTNARLWEAFIKEEADDEGQTL